jgi:multiple sugar transport system permease protein
MSALEIAFGVAIALLLNRRFRLTGFARTINLMPWAIPVVITGIAFRFAFDSSTGIFAHWFALAGFDAGWLTDVWPARALVIMTNVWRNSPFVAVLILAALQGIPEEFYEAGRVDGAGRFQSLRRITLPLIMPVIVTIGVFFLIWQVATFDLVLAMTGGGPGDATQVLGYEAYLTAFTQLDFGQGAALGVVLFAFVALFGIGGALVYKRTEIKV